MSTTVVAFPKDRIVRTPPTVVKKKKKGPWKIVDLKGCRPDGHPPLQRGPRGGLILAVGQVWVELHSGRLVVLERFELRRSSGAYRHQVWVRPYKPSRDYYLEEKGEASLRGSFRVWDDYVESMPKLMEKFCHSAATDPGSPFRNMKDPAAAARRFFGLDEKGNRVD